MSHLYALKQAQSLADVALLLGYKPASLAYLLYRKASATKYNRFEIPKRSGGSREILAPCEELKQLQRNLSNLLQNCLEELKSINGFSNTEKNKIRFHMDSVASDRSLRMQERIETNIMFLMSI